MKPLLKVALLLSLPLALPAQAPQIPVTGTLGAGGVFPLINSPGVVFATDANHTMTYPEMSGSSGFLVATSSTALTTTRRLIAPLVKGFTWAIENATSGSYPILVIGSTGTGVTIPSGYTMTVYCDGTNYVTLPSASGGTVLGVTASSPCTSTGGTNPNIACPTATSSQTGLLLSSDWSTFNNKQAALGFTPAHSGANSDITSLSGLTTPLPTSEGGTGSAGGTGYAYGNGSAAFSFSPTIPWSAITGGPSAAITTLTGDVAAGPGSGSQAATVQGLESVPFCTGFTPTNGQAVQYTTTSSPNPCYTAVTSITTASLTGGAAVSGNIVFGTGAGTSPSLTSIHGYDNGFIVNFSTGSSPAATSTIFAYNFTNPRSGNSWCTFNISQGGPQIFTSLGQMPYAPPASGTTFALVSGTTALSAATGYEAIVNCPPN